jgi:hypothetical protein
VPELRPVVVRVCEPCLAGSPTLPVAGCALCDWLHAEGTQPLATVGSAELLAAVAESKPGAAA